MTPEQLASIDFSDLAEQCITHMLEEEKKINLACEQFRISSKFDHIVDCIKLTLDVFEEEDFRYRPKEVSEVFGFEGITEEDIDLFINCLDRVSWAEKQNVGDLITCDFDYQYIHLHQLGLWLFKMWGQGCLIQISGSHFKL